MTYNNPLVCVTAALILFAVLAAFHNDARASHDADAVGDSQAAGTQLITPSETSIPPANTIPAAFRTMRADDEISARPFESPASSTITAANYIAIGSGVFTSLQSINSYSGMPALHTPGAAFDSASAPNLIRQAVDLLMFAIAGEPAVLNVDVRTSTCHAGGTVETDASFQQEGRIGPGDRISLSLSKCQLAADAHPLSGTAVFTFNQVDGTIAADQAWHAAVDVQLHELAIVLATNAVVGNGEMRVNLRQAGQGHRFVDVRSARLSEETRSGHGDGFQFAPAAHIYRDYKAVGTHAENSSAWDLSYGLTTRNGYFYSAEFVVSTLQHMVFDGGRYPVSGELKVTGKHSSMTLTALDGGMVRLDFSENGDGLVNQTTFLPSSKLLANGG